jgi:L-rhamnose mutarotase
MVRANNRNFSIFVVEIDKEIYEFFYFEYVGSDIERDGKLSADDPATQRWWKLTDACQKPLPDANGGVWSAMKTVVPATGK